LADFVADLLHGLIRQPNFVGLVLDNSAGKAFVVHHAVGAVGERVPNPFVPLNLVQITEIQLQGIGARIREVTGRNGAKVANFVFRFVPYGLAGWVRWQPDNFKIDGVLKVAPLNDYVADKQHRLRRYRDVKSSSLGPLACNEIVKSL